MALLSAADRRASPRVPLEAEAEFAFPEGTVRCRMVDVSASGLAVVPPPAREPPAGFVQVRFRVAADAGWLEADGVVVRALREPQPLWGVEFRGLSSGARTRLRDYVRRGHWGT
jgi:hypothetical protein